MNEFEIAAYLDRRLSGPERERAESHLAGCAECRDEVAQAHQLLRRARRPKVLFIAGIAAAAAVAVLVIGPGLLRQSSITADSLIRGGAQASPVVAYGPIGEVPMTSLRFVWAAEPGATTYRLTVAQVDGTPVWTRSGSDTAVTLPDSISLTAGNRYVWVADALLTSGGSRSTGLREFLPVR
jgi:hypothetical protein